MNITNPDWQMSFEKTLPHWFIRMSEAKKVIEFDIIVEVPQSGYPNLQKINIC